VLERPQRRRFSTPYKLKILSEVDQCHENGEIGLILRREGLYSSNLTRWRKWRDAMRSKPNKKPISNTLKNENARLQRENIRLKAKLERANKLLEVQKKMAELMENLKSNSDEDVLE
jgi:hypothetical protein